MEDGTDWKWALLRLRPGFDLEWDKIEVSLGRWPQHLLLRGGREETPLATLGDPKTPRLLCAALVGREDSRQLYGAVLKAKKSAYFCKVPGHLLICANLKLFPGAVNSDDLNEGHGNPCKMKLIESRRE